MIAIANGTDGAETQLVEASDFSRRHLDKCPAAFAVGKNRLLTGSAGDFTTPTGLELDVVNGSSKRHAFEWHCIACLRGNTFSGRHRCTDFKTGRCEDIRLLAVRVLKKCDAAGAIRIVFDADHRGRDIVLPPTEVDETIVALMATADVAAGDATGVVTAT